MIWMVFDDSFSVKFCGAAQAYAPPFEKDLLRAFLCWWKQPGHSRMVWSWKRIIAASASKKGHYCWWFRHPKANHRFWMYNTMKIMGWLSQWPTFKLLGIRYLVGKIKFKLLFHGRLAEYKWDIHGYSSYQLVIFSTISIKISCDFFSLRKGFLRPCGLVARTLCHEWKSYRTTTSPSSAFTDLHISVFWDFFFKDVFFFYGKKHHGIDSSPWAIPPIFWEHMYIFLKWFSSASNKQNLIQVARIRFFRFGRFPTQCTPPQLRDFDHLCRGGRHPRLCCGSQGWRASRNCEAHRWRGWRFFGLPCCCWLRNPANSPVEVGSLSHYLQGFIHLRWLFVTSSINSGFQHVRSWVSLINIPPNF